MKQEFLAASTWLDLPLLALGIFVCLFVAVVLRLYVVGRNDARWDSTARLPLADDAVKPPHGARQ
jgi:hypothetical protein